MDAAVAPYPLASSRPGPRHHQVALLLLLLLLPVLLLALVLLLVLLMLVLVLTLRAVDHPPSQPAPALTPRWQ